MPDHRAKRLAKQKAKAKRRSEQQRRHANPGPSGSGFGLPPSVSLLRDRARSLPVLEDALATWQARSEAAVSEATGVGPPPACKPGCAYCCHKKVDPTIPEVLHAVAFAREHLDAETLRAVTERANANAPQTHGKTADDYPARTPCAFLGADGACLVYPARPFACRDYHSLQVDPCVRMYETNLVEDVHVNTAIEMAASIHHGGWVLDNRAAGFDASNYELQEAASIALTDPQAGEKWLAGDNVFASALSHE